MISNAPGGPKVAETRNQKKKPLEASSPYPSKSKKALRDSLHGGSVRVRGGVNKSGQCGHGVEWGYFQEKAGGLR